MTDAASGVTGRLLTAIALGEFLPGERLPAERELAKVLGVGRMTARSALAELLDRGVITTVRGRSGGSFVSESWTTADRSSLATALRERAKELRDVSVAVGAIHGTVARAAAENRTASEADGLRDLLEGFRSATSGSAAQQADSRLHMAIAIAAHNATLREVLYALEGRISLSAPAHLWGHAEGMREMELRALGEHERLVAAITERDADEAERVARIHNHIDMELLERAIVAFERPA